MLPLIYVYRRVVKDSGGPGKYRGGVCHGYAITPRGSVAHSLGAVLYGKGVMAPHSTGIFGGYPGCNVDYIIFREGVNLEKGQLPNSLDSSSGKEVEHVQWGVFDIKDGDMLYIRFMGGGGYGDPIDRDPDLIYRDIQRELVSVECAHEIYGVVVDTGQNQVDMIETAKRREAIRKERLNGRDVQFLKRDGNVKETEYPVSEYLQMVDGPEGKVVQCNWCGWNICGHDKKWKKEVPQKAYPITSAGPLRTENDLIMMHQFYCPSCATCLDTEIIMKGDEPLYDEIVF
jgi:N-methylhydantoinase B